MTDLRLSVSKVKCFSQCNKQYEFNYILKMPKKDRDYHIFGKFCHKVLEDFHLSYINGSTEPYNKVMGQAFKDALIEYKPNMTAEMRKDCWAIIDEYLRIVSNDKKNNLSANVIACEKSFELPIDAPGDNKVILNGMIDRVQLDADNVIHVCDYKTVKNKKYLKNDFFQLLTYAFVILSEDPTIKKVRASYILLRHNFEYITTEFKTKDILDIKDQYLKYAQQIIEEKEFKPNPTALCNFCDFQDMCPEGKSKSFNQTQFGEIAW